MIKNQLNDLTKNLTNYHKTTQLVPMRNSKGQFMKADGLW